MDGRKSEQINLRMNECINELSVSIFIQQATICWLEQSLEAETLLDKKISFLFRPFHLPPDCLPLRDCVVTISQFSGILREHLVQLADLLGKEIFAPLSRFHLNDFQVPITHDSSTLLSLQCICKYIEM